MPKALTPKTVENLKPSDRRKEIPDPALVGLYLIIQASGSKSWAVRYRMDGKSRKHTLGRWPRLGVAAARRAATDALTMVELGNDPNEARRVQRAAKTEGMLHNTLAVQVDEYSKRHLSGLKRGRDTKNLLNHYSVSRWGDREIQTITRREIRELMDDISDAGKNVTANRVRSSLSAFFNWCIERDLLEHNPVIGTKRLREKSRDRVLSQNELRWFWCACENVREPWGRLGRTLLLTGQRRNEIAHMTEAEMSDDVWTLPAERAKNGRTHELPLSGAAFDLITQEPRVPSPVGIFFTTNGIRPVSGFSKGRRHIADRMIDIATEECGELIKIPHWTFHDIRRTVSTGMTRIGIPVANVEAVLNHVSGTRAGVAGIYNRHSYRYEKREALEAWASEVESVMASPK